MSDGFSKGTYKPRFTEKELIEWIHDLVGELYKSKLISLDDLDDEQKIKKEILLFSKAIIKATSVGNFSDISQKT